MDNYLIELEKQNNELDRLNQSILRQETEINDTAQDPKNMFTLLQTKAIKAGQSVYTPMNMYTQFYRLPQDLNAGTITNDNTNMTLTLYRSLAAN